MLLLDCEIKYIGSLEILENKDSPGQIEAVRIKKYSEDLLSVLKEIKNDINSPECTLNSKIEILEVIEEIDYLINNQGSRGEVCKRICKINNIKPGIRSYLKCILSFFVLRISEYP